MSGFYWSLSLVSHDVEHHVVGGAHSLFAYACEVVNAPVYIDIDNALRLGDMLPLHAQEGRQQSGGYAGADLQ